LRTKQKNSLSQNISEKNREINDFQKEIDDITDTLRALDEKLSGKDVAKIISELVRDRKNAETDLNILQREKEEKKEKKVKIDYLLEGYEQRLKKLNLANKENRRIEVYKTYAIEVYKALTKKLDEKEKQLRISLEQEINDIFKTIYNGGLSLDIDENYGIRVHASNLRQRLQQLKVYL
jgi:DNA sulfur modification protein DndD